MIGAGARPFAPPAQTFGAALGVGNDGGMTADEFLDAVRDFTLAMGAHPTDVLINPGDQDQIEAEVADGAPDPQVGMRIERHSAQPLGSARFLPPRKTL